MRASLKVEPGKGTSDFCPLDLLSDDVAVFREAVSKIYQSATERFRVAEGPSGFSVFSATFVSTVQPLLKYLHQLQIEYPVVLPSPTPGDRRKLSTAMTLRDVSVFVRLAMDQTSGQLFTEDVKLGDLDLKMTEMDNLAKWEILENTLVAGDWYAGKGLLSHLCAIERHAPVR